MIAAMDGLDTGTRIEVRLTVSWGTGIDYRSVPVIVDGVGRHISAGEWIRRHGHVMHAEQYERTRYPAWIGWLT